VSGKELKEDRKPVCRKLKKTICGERGVWEGDDADRCSGWARGITRGGKETRSKFRGWQGWIVRLGSK